MKSSSCFLVVAVDLARLRQSFKNTEPSFKNAKSVAKKTHFLFFPAFWKILLILFQNNCYTCYHLNENERF